jgi:quercetin 2,3-dioxygenase
MTDRTVQRVLPSVPTSDGAGVRLRRSLGASPAARLDPFLMLDHFSTENAADYIAGFPSHPHRGFETVTYMIDGHMLHEDHLGHAGDLTSGGVQWMTAGRGIIHSEMPQQDEGRMRGFQLWINLPAREKMKPAAYRNIEAPEIPVVDLAGGGRVKVVAGTVIADGRPVVGPIVGVTTDPLYLDVDLPAGARFTQPIAAGYSAFVYVFEGSAVVGPGGGARTLPTHSAGVLSDGDAVEVAGGPGGGRLLLIAGRPLREPVVQYGPFVMNTREEIEQAIRDYQNGELTRTAA